MAKAISFIVIGILLVCYYIIVVHEDTKSADIADRVSSMILYFLFVIMPILGGVLVVAVIIFLVLGHFGVL